MKTFLENLSQEQFARYKLLRDYLSQNRLTLRFDSSVCADFILYNERSLAQVQFLVAKAKYLHEYCDYKKGYEIAQHFKRPNMPKQDYLNLIEFCVLSTSPSSTLPDEWPWTQETPSNSF